MEGTESVAALIIQEGSETSPEKVLITACENGDDETISALLQQGRSPTFEFRSVDSYCVLQGEAGIYVFTLLACIAQNFTSETTQCMPRGAGVSPILTTPEGETPLIAAASSGHASTLQLLLDAGADPAAEAQVQSNSMLPAWSCYIPCTYSIHVSTPAKGFQQHFITLTVGCQKEMPS